MPQSVTEIIKSWLDREDTKWEATTDVVTWAESYGADLERAWAECPRASPAPFPTAAT